MHRIVIPKHGGPEVFEWQEFPSAECKTGQIRVRVHASGVNFADVQMRMGLYPEAPKPPFTPGYEISGVVSEVCQGGRDFQVGDRVVALTAFGGYADEIVLEERNVQKIPDGLSFTDAASIPVCFATAWVALHELARVRLGDRVLVHSAAGGVGVAAVQMAKNSGAHVTGLTSSPSKKKFLIDLGCDEVLNEAPTEGARFEVILDAAGGKSLKTSFKTLAPLGRMVAFGVNEIVGGNKRSLFRAAKLLLSMPLYTPIGLMDANKGVFGLNMLKLIDSPEKITSSLEQCLEQVASGKLKTVVGATYPMREAGAAHEHLQSRKNIGKVVLTV